MGAIVFCISENYYVLLGRKQQHEGLSAQFGFQGYSLLLRLPLAKNCYDNRTVLKSSEIYKGACTARLGLHAGSDIYGAAIRGSRYPCTHD